MKCFKFMTMILLVATLAVIACDDGGSGGGGTGDIAVSFVSAEQTGGTSATAESTGLTLTFDGDPTSLTVDNITVTGATKGELAGTGTTRSLAISNITVADGEVVSVTITSPAGYVITGSPQTAVVYRYNIPVTFTGATQTGGTSDTVDSTGVTLTFDGDPTSLTEDDITVTGATKGELTGTGTTRSLAISNITVADGETVSVAITSPAGYAITGSPQTAVVFRQLVETYTADSVSFVMVYVPGGLTFPTGVNDDSTATVTNAYWIGDTEVTYELWSAVYTWATSGTGGATGEGQYFFANTGWMGGYYNSGYYTYTSGHETHPVVRVNWRDSIVWCNALTEWYNAQRGTSYECVYTSDSSFTMPIRDSRDGAYGSSLNSTAGGFDNPYIDPTAKGFRLLTSNEWELAARYRGSDSTNTVAGYSNPYFTQGDSASGATSDYNYFGATSLVAWHSGNSSSRTHVVGTAGNGSGAARSGNANTLGLYDMSGNVWEWCFDLSGSYRMFLGGSWYNTAENTRVGYWGYNYSYLEFPSIGFRFARTQ